MRISKVLPRHGVHSILRVLRYKIHHLKSKSGEFATKEGINEKDVEDDIDKEEELAQKHPYGPVVVGVEGAVEELGKGHCGLHPLLLVQQGARFVQPRDDGRNLDKYLLRNI